MDRNEQVQTQEMIDLDGAKAAGSLGGFELLPIGQYEVRFLTEDLGYSQAGNPKVTGKVEVLSGPYTGKTVRDWVTFTAKGAPFLKLRFAALGLKGPGRPVTSEELAVYYLREANGRIALVTVGITPPNAQGKEFNEIVNISPRVKVGGPSAVTVDRVEGPDAPSVVPVDVLEEDVPF